jgi:DNA-binding CsgD family transcriptional regulator
MVRDTYQIAVACRHPWAVGELGQWLHRRPEEFPDYAAEPYRLAPLQRAQAWERIGCPYEAALAYAEDTDFLREALIRLERLGARPAADRIAKIMRQSGMRPPRRSTMTNRNGLTARESDVLVLIRQGLRNAEIARRLHISNKTVDHHVSAILAKLGVHTRREAARQAEG